MARSREEVERVFETWLCLSSDQELLWLFELVERALRRRGHRVECHIEPPPKNPTE